MVNQFRTDLMGLVILWKACRVLGPFTQCDIGNLAGSLHVKLWNMGLIKSWSQICVRLCNINFEYVMNAWWNVEL